MIQLKLFIKGVIILAIVSSCPIIISMYIISVYKLNVYFLVLTTIISIALMLLALKYYIKPQIKKVVATNEIITTGL